jgi:LCP family protein required for cell wall assembly
VPSNDKPYRVYRGGRARGPIKPLAPPERRPGSGQASRDSSQRPPLADDAYGAHGAQVGTAYETPPVEPEVFPGRREPREVRPRTRRRAIRWALAVVLVGVLAIVGWGVAGYFSLRHGVAQANERLPESASAALTPQSGSILSSPTNILLLGADSGPGRDGPGRSDSMVLVRTDPDQHRISMLSIPRDLRVEIPGQGVDKINAAYAFGGAALAIRTVEDVTGLPVNHVVLVDFSAFGELIDALGGVTIDVPERIVSNRFDCPYKTEAQCDRWPGWQFRKGEQQMDGARALVYSRIRENQLDQSETDVTRGERQQQVVSAMSSKLVGVDGFMRMPFIGDDVAKPLATDLTTGEIMRLGWVKFRSSSTLRCHLGGDPQEIDGVFYLVGTEDNVAVLGMVTGKTAPQPPRPGSPFAAGCAVTKS